MTVGEFLRTNSQQALYFLGYKISVLDGKLNVTKSKKRSKTLDGSHLKKLAADLNLFIDGKYRTDRESYKPLADYWKSLNENNVAGYDWGFDANHFEMK